MCQGEVKEITVLGIRQQIMSLEDGGQWLEALALALDHYESSILSQEDNKRNNDPTSLVLKNFDVMTRVDPSLLTDDEVWMAELLMRYLMLAVDNAPDSPQVVPSSSNNKMMNRLNLAESHFEMLSGNRLLFGACSLFTYFSLFSHLTFCLVLRCLFGVLYCHQTTRFVVWTNLPLLLRSAIYQRELFLPICSFAFSSLFIEISSPLPRFRYFLTS
jgi:hypothetical protein